jgi:hypothetical protein
MSGIKMGDGCLNEGIHIRRVKITRDVDVWSGGDIKKDNGKRKGRGLDKGLIYKRWRFFRHSQ